MKEKLSEIFLVSLFILLFGFCLYSILGLALQPKDVLVKETKDYLYYKEYTLYGKDSTIYKYHKPIVYDGIISKKDYSSHWVGLVGKGGHVQRHYKIIISYNNKTVEENDSWMYNDVEEGQNIKVIETFYPTYKITYKY